MDNDVINVDEELLNNMEPENNGLDELIFMDDAE